MEYEKQEMTASPVNDPYSEEAKCECKESESSLGDYLFTGIMEALMNPSEQETPAADPFIPLAERLRDGERTEDDAEYPQGDDDGFSPTGNLAEVIMKRLVQNNVHTSDISFLTQYRDAIERLLCTWEKGSAWDERPTVFRSYLEELTGGKPADALELAEDAMARLPHCPHTAYRIGILMLRAGNYRYAFNAFDKAIRDSSTAGGLDVAGCLFLKNLCLENIIPQDDRDFGMLSHLYDVYIGILGDFPNTMWKTDIKFRVKRLTPALVNYAKKEGLC